MSWIELAATRRPPTAPPGVQPPENAADWYRIENNATDPDATDIFVYDSIGGWFGVYADDFIRDLKAVTSTNINLRINSPGGSVFDGVAIANAIRSHPANVTVYVDGLAASIASVIALAGNKLVMMPQTSFMIHDASGGCYGNAEEMQKMVELLDKQSDNIATAYAAAAGGTTEEWRERMRAETWYTADEAVKAGLADEVMPLPAKEDDEDTSATSAQPLYARMTAAWDLSSFKYEGRAQAPAPVSAYAKGGLVAKVEINGEDVTEHVQPSENELIVRSDAISNLTRTDLVELIRETVRAAFPPVEEPDEEEEPEDAATEPAPDEDEEPDAALPPFLKPDEDEEEEEDPEDAASTDEDEDEPSEPPAAHADEWSSLVARITSPSPSADDVFKSLIKEAW